MMRRSYGTLALTVSSPAQVFVEPLSLADVKAFLNRQNVPADPAEDAMLEGFITAARALAETAQNRVLVPKQYDLTLDHFWDNSLDRDNNRRHNWQGDYVVVNEIQLRSPLISVDLVRYRDNLGGYTVLTPDVDYIADTARALVMPPFNQSWPSFTPWPSSAVLVRFTSGMTADDVFWSEAGTVVMNGMKYLISEWFNGRLPFEPAASIQEYPYTVTMLLGHGAIPRVK